jgi:oligoxyloglucan reducing-end-specific cellobiohydrolase
VTYDDGCGNGAYATDGGYAWNKFPTCAPGTGISSNLGGFIAVDASGRNVVWTTANGSAGVLTGPYFSGDYGTTWTISAGIPPTQSLASDKVAPDTFYGYNGTNFYLSSDAGHTFTVHPASKTGLPANSTVEPKIVVSPYKAGELWLPLGSDGLWHSIDFGMSWERIGHPYTATSKFSVGAAAPGRINPALYLWGMVTKTGPEGLYRSDDAGVTWVRVNDNAHQYGGPGLSGIQADSRTYGRVYMGIFGRGIVFADIVGNGTGVLPGTYGI